MLMSVLGISRLNMTSFSNEFAYLTLHKTSLKEKVRDYVLKFNGIQRNIEDIIPETIGLIENFIQSLNVKQICGRLISKINFIHFNSMTNEQTRRSYHFSSYKTEVIENVEDFYVRHLTKIASRLDSFNENGSNLLIENIECIYIQLTITT